MDSLELNDGGLGSLIDWMKVCHVVCDGSLSRDVCTCIIRF